MNRKLKRTEVTTEMNRNKNRLINRIISKNMLETKEKTTKSRN